MSSGPANLGEIVLARLSIGEESSKDGVGSVLVVEMPDPDPMDNRYRVYVSGGFLPDGRSESRHGALRDAFLAALAVVEALANAELRVWDERPL